MNFTASFTCDSVQSTSWARLLELWQAGDEIEIFEGAWTSDHLYPWQGGNGPCFEGWSALTALLCQTRRLRGGVLVTSVPYRLPGILAKMIATLDIASEGRLDIGLGAGWHEAECLAYGITLGDPSVRMGRLEETVVALLSLMTKKETTFHGHYVRLEQAMCEPKPKQSPHPPICIGGGGERRMLPFVARCTRNIGILVTVRRGPSTESGWC